MICGYRGVGGSARVCGMKDSETKWYHHLLHARVLVTILFTGIIYLLFAGFGIYLLVAK